MSAAYRLTPRAVIDLDEILEYYLREAGVNVCQSVVEEFERSLRLIADNPRVGHTREDLVPDPVRFWRVFRYFIIYYPDEKPLLVARIVHAQRDLALLAVDP
jgi:plasmid stabilization system protein ParE